MANLKTSIKDVRQSERKAVFNARMKRRFKDAVKEFNKLVDSGEAKSAEAYLPRVYKMLDKAAKSGVIKKGNASRRKSRLAIKLNKSAAPDVKTSDQNS